MSPLFALAFAFGSSLCWSGLDAMRKRLGAKLSAPLLVAAFSLGQIPIFAAWLALDARAIDFVAYAPIGAAAISLNLGANLLFVGAVQRSPLSVAVPFLAFTPVFTALLAMPILDQRLGPTELLGIAIVVLGGLLFGLSRDASDRPLWREPGVWMMLGVAGMWAGTTTLDAAAQGAAPPALHGLVQTGGVGIVLSLYLLARGGRASFSPLRPELRALGLTILFAAGAYGQQLLSLQGLDAAHVETLKRVVGLIMALGVGRLLFQEAVTRNKIVGVGLLALGTLVVAWGAQPAS